ncbi:MAG: glycosyltransferase 87 family protein [Planctomycetota bacterium]
MTEVPPRRPRSSSIVLYAAAGGFLLGARGIAALASEAGDGRAVGWLIGGSLLLLIPSLVLWQQLPRLPGRRRDLWIIIGVALLARLPLLPLEPALSDDLYRYLWDGRVQEAGLNPYGVSPLDPSLDAVEAGWPLDERVRERVNHPGIATIYPPGLELTFAAVARLGGGMELWKGALLLAEALLTLLLLRGLRLLGRDPRLVLLYLWHPLPLIEVAWSAHAELLAVLPFVWGAITLTEGRHLTAGLAIGASIAAKLLPVGFLATLLRRGGLLAALGCLAALVHFTLPYLGSTDPARAFAGLGEYAEGWYFNDLLFEPLGRILSIDPTDRTLLATRILRLALAGAWLGVALLSARQAPIASALTLTVAFVLLSPTVHPWYLLWVLPFAVLLEARPWWILAGTTLIAHEVSAGWLAAQVWSPSETRGFVYGAPLLLLAAHRGAGCWEDRRIARVGEKSA